MATCRKVFSQGSSEWAGELRSRRRIGKRARWQPTDDEDRATKTAGNVCAVARHLRCCPASRSATTTTSNKQQCALWKAGAHNARQQAAQQRASERARAHASGGSANTFSAQTARLALSVNSHIALHTHAHTLWLANRTKRNVSKELQIGEQK